MHGDAAVAVDVRRASGLTSKFTQEQEDVCDGDEPVVIDVRRASVHAWVCATDVGGLSTEEGRGAVESVQPNVNAHQATGHVVEIGVDAAIDA